MIGSYWRGSSYKDHVGISLRARRRFSELSATRLLVSCCIIIHLIVVSKFTPGCTHGIIWNSEKEISPRHGAFETIYQEGDPSMHITAGPGLGLTSVPTGLRDAIRVTCANVEPAIRCVVDDPSRLRAVCCSS